MSVTLHRGSVWMAQLPPPIGTRPVVVITRDLAIPRLTSVTVVPITSTVSGAPSETPVGPEEGLRHVSVASCDNLYTIKKRALVRRIGSLEPAKIEELNAAIRIALDL